MTSRWLIAAVPVAFGLAWQDAPPLMVFAAALVSIVPLVGLIGDATERLAARLGPTLGGLFNSTLNNLPELIIGGVALANGLAPVVKASLTGAILALTVHPNWVFLCAFFGAGLTMAGSTGWCGLAILMSKMPWNRVAGQSCCASGNCSL